MRTVLGYNGSARRRTCRSQSLKSGLSVDMKSANAALRSGLVSGSSTTWMTRVQGSSSTTRIGRLGEVIVMLILHSGPVMRAAPHTHRVSYIQQQYGTRANEYHQSR